MTDTAPRVHHPVFARLYARMSREAEARGQTEYRRRLLEGLDGRVVEVGAGNGLNFPHYPSSVTEVVAVEPEAHLRRLAGDAATSAVVPVRVLDATAERLPLDDASVDAAVASLVLCSVADQGVALRELRRVLRPGGELRFYEHVISERRVLAAVQRVGDATIWPRISGGCHAARDTHAAIFAAGFEVERVERFSFSPGAVMPAVPHILGVARRV